VPGNLNPLGGELMSPKNVNLEEYTEYITSTVGFMEIWQHCYYALLSNPGHSEK
jgi:hypothetical protein